MSIQLFLADKIVRLTMKRRFARNPDVLQLRPMMAGMPPGRVPTGVTIEQTMLGDVPAEKLSAAGARADRAMLYIHGGGFVAGKPANRRALTGRLAAKLDATVYAIEYRLAPEHPFPAGLDDCANAYRALVTSGIPPRGIVVGGDSAGGNLSFALALKLKSEGTPEPAALVALSPATDLASAPPSHKSNARADAMFDTRMFPTVVRHYCPGSDAADPFISPLRGDVKGLPPTLIQCSRDEILRDDGVLMAEKLRAAGTEVSLEVWPNVFHVWQLMADQIPESRKAIENIVSFVGRQWGSAR